MSPPSHDRLGRDRCGVDSHRLRRRSAGARTSAFCSACGQPRLRLWQGDTEVRWRRRRDCLGWSISLGRRRGSGEFEQLLQRFHGPQLPRRGREAGRGRMGEGNACDYHACYNNYNTSCRTLRSLSITVRFSSPEPIVMRTHPAQPGSFPLNRITTPFSSASNL